MWYPQVESVATMIREHYDKPEYEGTLFLINTYLIAIPQSVKLHKELFDKHVYSKHIVYYYLEHDVGSLKEDEISQMDTLVNVFGVNEFWDMSYKSTMQTYVREKYGLPTKFVPMRYTSLIKQIPDLESIEKTSDFCFVGGLHSDYRIKLISDINEYRWSTRDDVSFKLIFGTAKLQNSIPELNSSRFILDIKGLDKYYYQNQVRIFELLCMGYTVCVEKSILNMFPGLIYEWGTIEDLYNLKNKPYLHPTEGYKKMTYTNESYEKYVNYLSEQWNTQG